MADEPVTTETTETPAETPAKDTAPDPVALQGKLAEAEAKLAVEAKAREEAVRGNEELKRYVIGLVTQLQAQQATATEPTVDAAAKFRERFEADPQAALAETLDQAFVERVGPVLREHYETVAGGERERSLKAAVELGLPVDETYTKQADALWASMAANVKAKPGAYLDALKFAMISDLPGVVEKATARKVEHEKHAQMEGASAARGSRPRRAGLSAEEKAIAAELKISEEAYRKNRDEMFPEEM
jgi:hypothetical protein